MNKIAVFGNTGAGKSTLARKLAEYTKLPLHTLDKIQYLPGGEAVPHEQYLQAHDELLKQSSWIIDGYGCIDSLWQRLGTADTLVYIDLPFYQHLWWVTKRCFSGLFSNPEGWPENSPVLKSTLTSYKVLWLCHKKLTPHYRKYVAKQVGNKQVVHLQSVKQISQFVSDLKAKAAI